MTTPLVLFTVAALTGSLAGYPLARARWSSHAPRLAVALWHALSFSVVSSIVLGGAALALPVLPAVLTGGLSDFLARCAIALRAEFAAPLVLEIAGLIAAMVTLARLLMFAVSGTRQARGVRRVQMERLTLAARRIKGDGGDNLFLLIDDRAAAYCLPGGGRGTIVVSSGSLDRLEDDQVRLVLAHERAHLRQHHHLAKRVSATLVEAFGWVPLFRLAAQQVPLLLEMAADDAAMRAQAHGREEAARTPASSRRRLAHAVVTLASAPTASPVGALAAAGGSAVARVHRLSEPPLQLGTARASLLSLGVLVAFAGPVLVATAPAVCAAAMELCPFAFA